MGFPLVVVVVAVVALAVVALAVVAHFQLFSHR